jgi:predicted O-methyltransferase YrrM
MTSTTDLSRELLERAMKVGQELDLSECCYGPPHWSGDFVLTPTSSYSFLAGFVRLLELGRIMEIGTHYGGSALAMVTGLTEERARDARLVTVDVTRLNVEGMARCGQIQRLHGDSLDPAIVARALSGFEDHVDLLYVDTVHTYQQTLENLAVYANRLKPRFIILDDIRLNDDMRALWRDIGRLDPGPMFDVSDIAERSAAGFGVIACRYPFAWPESSPARLFLRRGAWQARRIAQAALPEQVRAPARRLVYGVGRHLRRE